MRPDDYASSCGIPLMLVVYQIVGFGRGDGRHPVVTGGVSVISEGACMPVQKLTQISAEMLYQAITDTQNQHYKHTTLLHVYIVRQNGRRKSNLDAFVAA